MVTEKPPYDASVENIRLLCEECRDVSSAEDEDLKEETEGLDGTTFDRNLEAAVLLGLFEKDEDGLYTPTKQGKKIGYGPDDGEEVKIFQDIVRENTFYNKLLGIVGKDLKEDDGDRYLTRDKVMKQIGINFDFGVGDRTLESASATFLKVLDAAGIGTYKQGRSGYPTRLVINDEYTGFVESVTEAGNSEEEETREEPVEESEIDEEENETSEQIQLDGVDDGTSDQEPDKKDSVEAKFQEVDSGGPIKTGVQESTQEVSEEAVLKDVANSSMDVQIDIEISSSDWEYKEVIELIETVQSE